MAASYLLLLGLWMSRGIGGSSRLSLSSVGHCYLARVRADSRGVASTFGTLIERSVIRRIERTLKIQLSRREVAEHVLSERKLRPAFIEPTPVAPPAKKKFFNKVKAAGSKVGKRGAGRSWKREKPSGFKPKRHSTLTRTRVH